MSTTGNDLARCAGAGCEAAIRWVVTVGDKRMPIDPDPADDGNVALVMVDGYLRAKVLGGGDDRPEGPLYRPHWQTCPASPQFRAKAWRTAPKCAVCGEPMDPTLARRERWVNHPGCDQSTAIAVARDEIRPTAPAAEPTLEAEGVQLW